MNSPFGKKMSDKNPISVLQQNAFYAALNDAKEKGKDNFKVGNKTFNVSDSAATMSPYHKHGEKFRDDARKRSEETGTPGDYNRDDPEVVKLLEQAKAADARHVEERKAKKTATKVDSTKMAKKDPAPKKKLDKSDSVAQMSPFNQGGYVGGGMSASDYASTADLYQNMFDKVEGATKEFMEGQAGKEKDSFKKVGNRIGDVADTGVDYKFGQTLDDGLYAVGNKGKKENTFQKYS